MSNKIFITFSLYQIDWIDITKDSGNEVAKQFVNGLLIQNASNYGELSSDLIEYLIQEMENDDLIISGGLHFSDGKGVDIFPGCCCGMEEWFAIKSDLMEEKSPWMGHDPDVKMIKERDGYLVTEKSSQIDIQKSNREIFFDKTEFMTLLSELDTHFSSFADGPLYDLIKSIDENKADRFRNAFYYWFGGKK